MDQRDDRCRAVGRLWALALALVLGGLAAPGGAWAQTGAHELVKRTSEEVLSALKARHEELSKHPGKIYEFVEQQVVPHFDFDRMSRLVLGKYWRRATPEERQAFIDQFRTLLVRTYGTAMLKYSDQKINYLPYRPRSESPEDVVVQTEVEQPGGPSIPIDYRLYKAADGDWKVYDVAIDGVSLVLNYRSSFTAELRKSDMAGLIGRLRERNQQALNE